MTLELSTKPCTKCGETKPLSEFHRNRRAKDGRHSWCKVCMIASVKRNQSRLRAEIGDGAYRALKRDAVRRHRQTPQGKEATRLQTAAYDQALRNLREAHPEEFEALYRIARHEHGLPI